MISIVVATDKNGVIGRENKIPWRIRDDLVRLKNLTKGHTAVLGRITYDSMSWYYDKSGRPMPAKTYIVVTRNPDYKPSHADAVVAHSFDEAVSTAKSLGDEQIFVLGGAEAYKQMLPFVDRVYLTVVQTEAEGDVRLPEFKPEQWREVSREHHKKSERNEFDFDWVILERV